MGIIFSCCRNDDVDENEALLANQQNGYGAHNEQDYNEVQRQMKEQEERALARETQLREIVTNTNDKLIDISMISNSGIVVPGGDIKSINSENMRSMELGNDNEVKKKNWVKLDPKKHMSRETKDQLKTMHGVIFNQLEQELKLDPPGKLTVTL